MLLTNDKTFGGRFWIRGSLDRTLAAAGPKQRSAECGLYLPSGQSLASGGGAVSLLMLNFSAMSSVGCSRLSSSRRRLVGSPLPSANTTYSNILRCLYW